MQPLPTLWTTDRLIIRDSGLEEITQLRDIFNANANVGQQGWDPTFTVIDAQEIERLVQQSDAHAEPGHENFQMQTFLRKRAARRLATTTAITACLHGPISASSPCLCCTPASISRAMAAR